MALALFSASPAKAQSMSPYREYEPIVFEAEQWPLFLGYDASHVALYIWKDGTHFEPIPFQIDKRRKIHVNFNVGPDDPGYDPENCEYGYYQELYDAPDPAQGPRADFSGSGLNALDEVVFLAKDTFGSTGRAPTTVWIAGQVSTTRYEITILDPSTGAKSYAYAFLWNVAPASSEFDPTDYVSWEPISEPCSSSPDACSAVRSNTSTPRLSDVATLDVQFDGNWITTGFSVHPDGNAAATPDTLERYRYMASPGQGENETGWSNGGRPRFLGYTDGKIRVVRAVQGALSGRRTTKYEFIYPTMFVTRVNLRVHDITLITIDTDHDRGFRNSDLPDNAGYLWAKTRFDANPQPNPQYMDAIDGSCVSGCDPTGFGIDDWTQVTSPIRSGYVQLFRERRAMPIKPEGRRGAHYADSASGMNEATWSIGQYGREWTNLSCTEDGTPDNSGGCIDPEGHDEELFFARLETVMIPRTTFGTGDNVVNVVASELSDNLDSPLRVTAARQYRDTPPTPQNPCTPTLGAADPQTGIVNLSITPSGPCGGTVGTRLFRSEAGGSFQIIDDLRSDYAFTDYSTRAGVTYQYKAVSYNEENTESAYSPVVSITPTDSMPPPPPDGLTGFGDSGSAILDAAVPCTRQLSGVNIYGSLTSGGPYTKFNATPIPITARPVRWTVGGLQPDSTWYFVATVVDFEGNESAYSVEVAITVLP